MNKMTIKQSNSNTVDTHTWRSLLFELLLNKQILKKVLKDVEMPYNSTVHIYKRDNSLTRKLKTYFDIFIKIVNNDDKEEKEIYILLGNYKIKPEYSDILPITIYRSKTHMSLEDLIYSSTNKKAKIIFSFFRSCDKRQIFTMYSSDDDLIKLPFYALNNLNLPLEKFLEITYKKLGSRNKTAKKIIEDLIKNSKCAKKTLKKNLEIDDKQLNRSLNKLLKRLPYLQRFINIDNNCIKLK